MQAELSGEFVMDPQSSGQNGQTCNAPSFQWLSFAYQGLTEIPYETILLQTDTLEVLDLSYNLLDEYPFFLPTRNHYTQWDALVSHVCMFLPYSLLFMFLPTPCMYHVKAHHLSVLLHSVLIGTRLCWVSWRSSALWSWTATTTHLTSSSPTCPASPPSALTRTSSTTYLCLWMKSDGSSQTSSKPGICRGSCWRIYRDYLLSVFSLFRLFNKGSWAWWTMKQHLVILMEEVWPSTKTTGENQAKLEITLVQKFLSNHLIYEQGNSSNGGKNFKLNPKMSQGMWHSPE